MLVEQSIIITINESTKGDKFMELLWHSGLYTILRGAGITQGQGRRGNRNMTSPGLLVCSQQAFESNPASVIGRNVG